MATALFNKGPFRRGLRNLFQAPPPPPVVLPSRFTADSFAPPPVPSVPSIPTIGSPTFAVPYRNPEMEAQDRYIDSFRRTMAPTPEQMVADRLMQRDAMGREAVNVRMQEQLENGIGGARGDGRYYPQDPSAVAGQLNSRVPSSQLAGFRKPDTGSIGNTKVVPGIGHVTQVQQSDAPGYGNVMTGRYGTGSATFGDKPPTGGTVTENGKTTALAPWFQDAARRQGESNQFFNKEGRKIVPDKA